MNFLAEIGRVLGINPNSNSNSNDPYRNRRTPAEIARNTAAENARRAANAVTAAKREQNRAEIARLRAELNRDKENAKRARNIANRIDNRIGYEDDINVMETVPETNETQDGGRRKRKYKKSRTNKKTRHTRHTRHTKNTRHTNSHK